MSAKKSPERRQRGTTRDIGIVPRIDVDPAAFPLAPAHLSDRWKAAWLTFWKSPFAQLAQAAQTPAIERLFGLYDERERMDGYLRENPMSIGSQGQQILNPMYRARTAVDSEIRQLEDRFGLNPKGGLQLGIVYGEAARSLEELNARIAYAAASEAEAEEDPRRLADSDDQAQA